MTAPNHVIERLEKSRAFEHRGETYPIGRSTPLTVCQKYHDLIIERPFKRILEIGTLYGQSTLFLAEAARATGGHVTTIDLRTETRVWINNVRITNIHEVAERLIKEAELDHIVKFVSGNSNKVMPLMIEEGKQFDFILVDGSHEYPVALLDFINADRLIRKGGIIAMDDLGANIARKDSNGGPNRILPMIFSCGHYLITPINDNIALCEKVVESPASSQ